SPHPSDTLRFFFPLAAPPLSLHSFPTRRSSDLYASTFVFSSVAPSLEPQAINQVRAAIGKRQRFSATDKRAVQMFGRKEFRPVRSEEHTSELQSRGHLVCRLLLEKKKKTETDYS